MNALPFDCDDAKSAANKAKHGITFLESLAHWNRPALALRPAALVIGERRFARFVRVSGTVWATFFTLRAGRIRIISVRHASRQERSRLQAG